LEINRDLMKIDCNFIEPKLTQTLHERTEVVGEGHSLESL